MKNIKDRLKSLLLGERKMLNLKILLELNEEEMCLIKNNPEESNQISIKQYFEYFKIKPEETQIYGSIKRSDNENIYEKIMLMKDFPPAAVVSTENFSKYLVPEKLVQVPRNRVKDAKKRIYEQYREKYENPQIPWTIERAIGKTLQNISDVNTYLLSLGNTIVVREDEIESYRRKLSQGYHRGKETINRAIPQITESILNNYLMLERKRMD